MIHYGLAGVFGAPRAEPTRKPDADRFRLGDVWESPRGTLYKVIDAKGPGVVIEPMNSRGRRVLRHVFATGHDSTPWVRQSWGGQP